MALKIALVLVLLHMGGYSGGQCQQLNTKTGRKCVISLQLKVSVLQTYTILLASLDGNS